MYIHVTEKKNNEKRQTAYAASFKHMGGSSIDNSEMEIKKINNTKL